MKEYEESTDYTSINDISSDLYNSCNTISNTSITS
jgi:hypothetical protein